MPADISERELVDQIKRGDKEAFRGLYDRYARLVYRYVMVRLGTSQDAEDLTSETFIRFWQNVRSFQWREIQVGAWLFRTAHNLIVDKYRKKPEPLGWSIQSRHNEDERFKQVEDQDVIRQGFETLSYERQMILYLHYIEGYSIEEVAKFVGKSTNAVRVAEFRALKALRKILQESSFEVNQ